MNASSCTCSSSPSAGTSSLATSSPLCLPLTGYAGSFPIMSSLTSCLVRLPALECPSSPLTGRRLPILALPLLLHGGPRLTLQAQWFSSTVSSSPCHACNYLRILTGIIVPALYYTNTWYAKFLPISSTHSFDNTGKSYNVARILDDSGAFSEELYKQYSPLFLSTTFALSYGLSFASITGELRS